MKAAEEEASEADSLYPEEKTEPEPPPETELPDAYERASDDEITSALRGFTWGSVSALKEFADAAEDGEPEELPEVTEEAVPEEDSEVPPVAGPEAFFEEPPEKGSRDAAADFAGEEFTAFRDEAPEEAADEPSEGIASEAGPADEAEAPQPEEQPPEEKRSSFSAFAGLAEFLGRMKGNSGEPEAEPPDLPKAETRTPEDDLADAVAIFRHYQEEEEASEAPPAPGDGESPEEEIDPEDVAKLWEPRAHRGIPPESAGHGELDPDREETHVFTEEDLKNLPRDTESDEVAGEGVLEEDFPDEEEEEGYTPRDFRPIRRRRYYRSGIVGGIMYFLFVVCVSVTLAAFAWLAADDVLSLNKEYLEAEVYVGEDMDVDQIATELHTKGLIRYRRLFSLFGKFFHAEEKIEPGTYTLSTKLDYRALIQNMHHYTGWTGEALETVKVTIPEGKTVMETFQILADHGVCPYETLMECAATETFDYSFLKDIPAGDATRLEGFLFPDTYEFYADSSPKAAICRFLDNFGERIPERVEEQASALGYSLREIVIVASLIEKEAGSDTERATIASVIYNRLQSTSYPYLQIDATIQYAMGEHKEYLTSEDLEVDSPYNTYKYTGLPPGPIANPGLASIRAALSPESTGYYFYALDKSGKHKFFSSYNEFLRFINSSDFGG